MKSKYVWSDMEFDKWIKEQKKRAEESGINTSSSKITKLLMKVVIIPNNIALFEKPKTKKIKIKI